MVRSLYYPSSFMIVALCWIVESGTFVENMCPSPSLENPLQHFTERSRAGLSNLVHGGNRPAV